MGLPHTGMADVAAFAVLSGKYPAASWLPDANVAGFKNAADA
jgi:hypothetical protein